MSMQAAKITRLRYPSGSMPNATFFSSITALANIWTDFLHALLCHHTRPVSIASPRRFSCPTPTVFSPTTLISNDTIGCTSVTSCSESNRNQKM